MKVIGIGLPRTGLTSLATFLRLNGLRTLQYELGDLVNSGLSEIDACVDFPMQIMAPWILETTDCLAIMTVRMDLDELTESTRNWCNRFRTNKQLIELNSVNTILYGNLVPTKIDIQAAQGRIDSSVKKFQDDGRVLRLDLMSPSKAADVLSFLGIKDIGVDYPHENASK